MLDDGRASSIEYPATSIELTHEAISNLHLHLDGRGLMRIDHVNGKPDETISNIV
jgi:hypothetical protein